MSVSNRIESNRTTLRKSRGTCLETLQAVRVSLIDRTLTQLQMNQPTNCKAPVVYLQTRFTITMQLSSQVNVVHALTAHLVYSFERLMQMVHHVLVRVHQSPRGSRIDGLLQQCLALAAEHWRPQQRHHPCMPQRSNKTQSLLHQTVVIYSAAMLLKSIAIISSKHFEVLAISDSGRTSNALPLRKLDLPQ